MKKFLIWTLVAVSIQMLGLFYINNFYLSEKTSFSIRKVENKSKSKKAKLVIDIPKESKDPRVSYNGKYVAYEENGVLKVVDRENGKKKEIQKRPEGKLAYYTWLPDRDRLYIAEKVIASGQSFIKVASYDAATGEKTDWMDTAKKEVKITLPSNKYTVKDMALSTLNGVTYIQVGAGETKNQIYRVNVMSEMEKIATKECRMGNIGMMALEDKFIYENLSNKSLYMEGHKKPLTLQDGSMPCFLGADFEDVAYIGSKKGENITKIFYGEVKTPIEQWKSINLTTPTARENIQITKEGDIFVDDPLKGILIELKSKQQTPYKGNLIKIDKSTLVYMEGGKLLEMAVRK